MSANFSDLQSVDTANGADQMMLRLNNGATGPDGFARIEISDLNSVFTSNLTAADAKVKELSAQWSAAYTEVNANSSVFTVTVANSGFWSAAYDAVTGVGTNLGIKEFDYVTINGPFDPTRSTAPVFTVKRLGTTADMVQVIPTADTSMFRITTAGSVGININKNYTFATDEVLYVNGNQRIDGAGGNALTVNGNVFVNGSLSALSATYINSIVTNTSALSVTNNGLGPALFVRQNGIQPVIQLRSDIASTTFTYNGDITGFRDLSGTGRIIAGINNTASNAASHILGTNNNDNNNNNVIILGNNISAQTPNYTYVQNLSTAGIVAAGGKTSNDWNSTYTTVNTSSAAILPLFTIVGGQSANNTSVYSTTSANSATWGALGTVFYVASATNTSALTAIGTNVNINAALVAKGTGATLAQIPDNALSGGNARGAYATDWQKIRLANDQVAYGDYSTIGGGGYNKINSSSVGSTIAGGDSNTTNSIAATIGGGSSNVAGSSVANGDYSTIGGGAQNSTTEDYATIAGGANNLASGEYSTIGGGKGLSATGNYSAIGGGYGNIGGGGYATVAGGYNNNATENASVGGGNQNTASGLYSTVAGGRNNTADNEYATIAGGYSNTAARGATVAGGYDNSATQNYSTVGGGYINAASGNRSTVVGGGYNVASGTFSTSIGVAAYATNYGELAVSSGYYNSYGDNKSSTFLLRRTTNSPGSAVAYLDGLTNTEEITLPPNSTYAYTATIVGLSSHSNSSGLHYILRGFAKCIDSGGSSVVTIYPATSDLTQKIPTTLNAGISAAGDKLRVVVYSPSNAFHYWTARIQAECIQQV
jgi:hypothetical protein